MEHCHDDPWWAGVITVYVMALLVVAVIDAFCRVSPDYDKPRRPLDWQWVLGSIFWPVYLVILARRWNRKCRKEAQREHE